MVAPAVPDRLANWLKERSANRVAGLTDRLSQITGTRGTPDVNDVVIGSARETRGAILFVDIVQSTRLAIRYRSTPENMLATLNIVIPTLMDAAWWFEGEMEKNTGDGLLVYFGMGTNADDEDAALKALGAIRAMRWATVNVITPQLRQRGLRELQITIGADLGDVLLAKIGLRQIDAPLVAVGEVANRAAKIQATCKPGEARIGENLLNALPVEERKLFVNVWPQKPWPFVADRSKLQVASQELEAATRAQDENSRRYWTAVRLGLFQWWPVKPDPVSPTRPYRIYRTKPA